MEWEATEWENITDPDEGEGEQIAPSEIAQQYIQWLTSESRLHLLKPKKIERAYTKHAEKGLFGLFVSTRLKKAWRIWTNAVLVAKGETPITAEELDAFIGLELAMSLVPITDMKEL
ncbi:hypothetical protein PHYSODRAFT_510804, partial [Phytophthora sojae]